MTPPRPAGANDTAGADWMNNTAGADWMNNTAGAGGVVLQSTGGAVPGERQA